jgi:hypothetical protein
MAMLSLHNTGGRTAILRSRVLLWYAMLPKDIKMKVLNFMVGMNAALNAPHKMWVSQ